MESTQYVSTRAEVLPFLPPGVRRVLDVGCGAGYFGEVLKDADSALEVWGVEPDAIAAAEASSRIDRLINDAFPTDQIHGEQFDAIFFNGVLEHMADPVRALEAARLLLQDNGRVVAVLPNVRHFSVWLPLVFRGEWRYEDDGILDRTHLRFFTESTARELFEENGWAVDSCVGVNKTPYRRGGSPPRWLLGLSKASLRRLDPFFYSEYVVTAH